MNDIYLEEDEGRFLTWKYKDSSRTWWSFTARESYKSYSAADDAWHHHWTVEVYWDDLDYPIWSSSVGGQYDKQIDLEDILKAWSSFVNSVCIGASRWSEGPWDKDRAERHRPEKPRQKNQ